MTSSENTTPYPSSEYDQQVKKVIPFYNDFNEEVIDIVQTICPDANHWLDTGCGTGYLVESALPTFPQTQFFLADPSEEMLRQAKLRFQGKNSSRLTFLQPMTSEEISSRIDGDIHPQVITAIQSHHYLQPPERRQAVESCYRILQEEGVFITVENITPHTQEGVQISLERWKQFQLKQGRDLSTVEYQISRFGVSFFPITIIEHFEVLYAAGFRTVEIFWLSHMQAGFCAIK
jgi:tRNA (cmo5U34)-methyltransferase